MSKLTRIWIRHFTLQDSVRNLISVNIWMSKNVKVIEWCTFLYYLFKELGYTSSSSLEKIRISYATVRKKVLLLNLFFNSFSQLFSAQTKNLKHNKDEHYPFIEQHIYSSHFLSKIIFLLSLIRTESVEATFLSFRNAYNLKRSLNNWHIVT